jgi:hypothetical protein
VWVYREPGTVHTVPVANAVVWRESVRRGRLHSFQEINWTNGLSKLGRPIMSMSAVLPPPPLTLPSKVSFVPVLCRGAWPHREMAKNADAFDVRTRTELVEFRTVQLGAALIYLRVNLRPARSKWSGRWSRHQPSRRGGQLWQVRMPPRPLGRPGVPHGHARRRGVRGNPRPIRSSEYLAGQSE